MGTHLPQFMASVLRSKQEPEQEVVPPVHFSSS
jgi:hypothetical protein